MSIHEKIDRAIEQRKAEAAEKNLTHKLLLVVTTLGEEVRSQSAGAGGMGLSAENSYRLEEGWAWELEDEEEEEGIPVMDISSSGVIGWYFDGLTSGMNLQIYSSKSGDSLRVTYDGYTVFHETNGNLECYLPSPQWEVKLESLHSLAKPRAKIKDAAVKADKKDRDVGRGKMLLDRLRRRWGF